jgi:predicted ferric reductase
MPKRNLYTLGWPLLITLSIIPIIMWLQMVPYHYRFSSTYNDLTSIGRTSGIAAVICYAYNLILTTRLRIFEDLFGGLNKMFIAHHIIGATALCFALVHSMSLTVRLIQVSPRQAALLTIPGTTNWATTFGILALWGLIILLFITFYVALPYRIWLFTHKFLGLVFISVALHVILINSDTSTNKYLKYYLLGLVAAAIASFIYRTLLPRFFARRYRYQLTTATEIGNGVVRLNLMPIGRALDFKSGQFIFVSFRFHGFSHEWHPFTISSNSRQGGLTITVKNLGEYTDNLVKLGPQMRGAEVWVEGAYGRFSFRNFSARRQIWVAGGIGITPFLSMLPDVTPDYKVDLYYSVRTEAELIDYTIMQKWAEDSQGSVRVIPIVSEKDGLLTANKINQLSNGFGNSEILLCGPPPMMHALKAQLKVLGVKKGSIHSEEFALS